MRVIISILLMWVMVANGTNYYVDFAGGNNSNNGTTTGTAWKHCPGDANATGNASSAASTIGPGDSIIFKGGVTYVGKISLGRSGTLANPLKYDGTTWNGSRAYITSSNAVGSIFGTTGSRSNIWIHGLYAHNAGGYHDGHAIFAGSPGSITSSAGSTNYGGFVSIPHVSQDIVISNNYVERIGHWHNVTENASETAITGVGILVQGGRRISIVSNEFTKCNIPIRFYPQGTGGSSTDMLVHGNLFHNYIRWAVDIAFNGANQMFSNIVVRGGAIYNMHEYDSGNWIGQGEKPHTDGIILRVNSTLGGVSTNVLIDGVLFHSDEYGNSNGGTACIFATGGMTFDFQNCIFANGRHGNEVLISFSHTPTQKQVVGAYNNVFLDPKDCIRLGSVTSSSQRTIHFQNNIVMATGPNVNVLWMETSDAQTNTLGTINNNLYFNTTESTGSWAIHRRPGDTSMTFADTQAQGWDLNSLVGDPMFVDANALGALADCRLETTSPAIGVGADLSAKFTSDYDRSTRTTPWTMGAFINSVEGGDETAPEPDPMTFVSVVANGHDSIVATATTATDAGGTVVYQFEVVGVTESEAQTSTTYTATGLSPETQYDIRVRARDPSGNFTEWSEPMSATTDAAPVLRTARIISLKANVLVVGE